jgi:hypothetical protein
VPISQQDAARLHWAAAQWAKRAVAVHNGKRPCDVKQYEAAFAELVAQLVVDEAE